MRKWKLSSNSSQWPLWNISSVVDVQDWLSGVCKLLIWDGQWTFEDFEPRFYIYRHNDLFSSKKLWSRCLVIDLLIERHGNRRFANSHKRLDLAAVFWLAYRNGSGQIHTILINFIDFNANTLKNSLNLKPCSLCTICRSAWHPS